MKKNSFVEGTLIATSAIILVKILGMLYVIPFYAIVGSKGGALYSYAYNIYLIFLGISSAGLPNAISKIISEYHALGLDEAKNRTYNLAKKIISFISVITFLILFILAEEIGTFIIGDLTGGNTAQEVAFVIRCISPSVLIIPFLSITKGYLQGHQYIGPSSISQLIEQVLRIIVILLGSFLVLNVFNGNLSLAIGIAVSGAFFGGLGAYLYLHHKIKKSKLLIKNNSNKDDISNKEIIKKIITYAVPFVIINIVTNLYTFTDQLLVLKTIKSFNYSAVDVEFIASSISTWSPKICMIINAMAMGLSISIIPSIVASYTKKDIKDVESKINTSIGMVFYISLPLAIGLSILSKQVWSVFYQEHIYGTIILSISVFVALLANVYMVVSTISQSLSKFKIVYLVSIVGFSINALLDIPLMHLCNNIGIEGFIGSIIASIIGFSTSILIGTIMIKKDLKISYKKCLSYVFKTLILGITMAVILILMNSLIPISNKYVLIIFDAVVGAIIYLGLSIKIHLMQDIFGLNMINRIIKKLTRGKLELKK